MLRLANFVGYETPLPTCPLFSRLRLLRLLRLSVLRTKINGPTTPGQSFMFGAQRGLRRRLEYWGILRQIQGSAHDF